MEIQREYSPFLYDMQTPHEMVIPNISSHQELKQTSTSGKSCTPGSLSIPNSSLYSNSPMINLNTLTNPSLRRVLFYINQNYMHRLTLEIVAQHVFLNKTYISQLFSKYLGISFVSYLESIRIYKAQVLLQTTDLSVTKIAKASGYSSQGYFTKVFKKRVGVGPLQYRSNFLLETFHYDLLP